MTSDEKKVLYALGKDFTKLLYEQSNSIIQAIVEIANKSGYHPEGLPYLFFVLFERKKDWPRLSKGDFGAMNVLTNILAAAGEVPSYRNGLKVPDKENEKILDDVLKKVAIWMQTKLAAQLLRGYVGLLKKYAPAWLNASEDTTADKAIGVLKYIFEESILGLPIHSNSTLMSNAMRFIL